MRPFHHGNSDLCGSSSPTEHLALANQAFVSVSENLLVEKTVVIGTRKPIMSLSTIYPCFYHPVYVKDFW